MDKARCVPKQSVNRKRKKLEVVVRKLCSCRENLGRLGPRPRLVRQKSRQIFGVGREQDAGTPIADRFGGDERVHAAVGSSAEAEPASAARRGLALALDRARPRPRLSRKRSWK